MAKPDISEKNEIQWLGQMGLLIRLDGITLCVDYFASPHPTRQTKAPLSSKVLKDVDVFLGTHDHLDHMDHEAWKIWAKENPKAKFIFPRLLDHMDHEAWKIWAKENPKAKFIFPRLHRESVLSDGVSDENAWGMNDGETRMIGSVSVHAVAAAHEFLDRDEPTGLYPHLQYIIEGAGVKIHHAGDTVRYEGMLSKIRQFGVIDVELLPINGRDARRYSSNCIGNMTFQEAADFAGEVTPKMILPGHWDMFADNSADPKEFKDYIEVKYPGKMICLIPNTEDIIPVRTGNLSPLPS